MEYIENLWIMMNWIILNSSRRVVEQRIVRIFNWYIFNLLQGKAVKRFGFVCWIYLNCDIGVNLYDEFSWYIGMDLYVEFSWSVILVWTFMFSKSDFICWEWMRIYVELWIYFGVDFYVEFSWRLWLCMLHLAEVWICMMNLAEVWICMMNLAEVWYWCEFVWWI